MDWLSSNAPDRMTTCFAEGVAIDLLMRPKEIRPHGSCAAYLNLFGSSLRSLTWVSLSFLPDSDFARLWGRDMISMSRFALSSSRTTGWPMLDLPVNQRHRVCVNDPDPAVFGKPLLEGVFRDSDG